MIYLTHPSGDFAAIENLASAERYEARGYTRCKLGAFRAAWRARDERTLAEMRPVEQERTVGDAPRLYYGVGER